MSLPFMPISLDAYAGGTTAFDAEEHGAYLLLLMEMWRSEGSLPDRPGYLARVARVSPRRWAKVWASIGSKFIPHSEGRLTNERLAQEYRKATAISEQRSTAGKASVKAKSLKSFASNPTSVPAPLVAALPPRTPTLVQSTIEEKEEAKASSKKTALKTALGEDWTLPRDWVEDALAVAVKAKQPITYEEIENEADGFRDHSHSKSVRHANWRAAWRNWIRNYIKWRKPRNASGSHGPRASGQHGGSSIADAAIRRHLARQNGNGVPDDRGRHDVPAEGDVIEGQLRLVK